MKGPTSPESLSSKRINKTGNRKEGVEADPYGFHPAVGGMAVPSKGSEEEVFLECGDGDCFPELAALPGTASLVHLNFHLLGISEVKRPESTWYQLQQHFFFPVPGS